MAAAASADAAQAEGVPLDGAGPATGVARAASRSFLVSGYSVLLKTFARYAAAPHKLFRPENPTVLRLELAINSSRGWHLAHDAATIGRKSSAARAAAAASAAGSRGFLALWRVHGLKRASLLKGRSVAVNSLMGTVLFGTYDIARASQRQHPPEAHCIGEHFKAGDEMPFSLGGTVAAAALAGCLHGALCAPLEVAALRLRAAAPSKGPVFWELWAALNQRLPVKRLHCGREVRLHQGALMTLGMLRDGLGVCAFFVAFEGIQHRLHQEADQLGAGLSAASADPDPPPSGSVRDRLLMSARIGGTMLAGACAGASYKVVSWPFDLLLVRSTKSCERGGPLRELAEHSRRMVAELGWRRALLPPAGVVASTLPASALGLLLYEALR
mmetsp:Transcript_103938/g.291100  ORF Transcript_103938/g.291100 Transcript_103938/m.291100 type:complete len:386 (+) Transcript_103938:187-1344(+)